ncbi:MAG: ankyrin repeat domain-containing protein [Alphaproteobacteria bacterium]|nr:ankyrin repeat domain-containing protein [Alphaproteobacteria bacterium]
MVAAVTPFHPASHQDNLNDRFLAAAGADDIPALRGALAEGAQINARGDNNETAIIHAAREGRSVMIEILLGLGASLDLQDRDGRTALAQAARGGHIGIVSMLIRAGADITLDDKAGDKPLDIALRSGNPALVALFEQPLKDLLARIPSADTGPRLQYRRAPACPPDPHGDTMLTWAAREGQENVVRAMLQSGADVFMRNRAGQTPRDVAETAGHRLIACMLEDAETRQDTTRLTEEGQAPQPEA